MQSLPVSAQAIGLLLLSNIFMTFAWYGHLKNLAASPWYIAALASWGIALFEYLLQAPGRPKPGCAPSWGRERHAVRDRGGLLNSPVSQN